MFFHLIKKMFHMNCLTLGSIHLLIFNEGWNSCPKCTTQTKNLYNIPHYNGKKILFPIHHAIKKEKFCFQFTKKFVPNTPMDKDKNFIINSLLKQGQKLLSYKMSSYDKYTLLGTIINYKGIFLFSRVLSISKICGPI